MRLTVPLADGMSLSISDESAGGQFPTGRLQKGLLLVDHDRDLAEEGVGFGVPVVKRGLQTVFPGSMRLSWQDESSLWKATAAYEMNLVERLAGPDGRTVRPGPVYAAKDALAALHRRSPPLRGLLTATSDAVRRIFRWATAYERVASAGTLTVAYAIDRSRGAVSVAVDLTGLSAVGITEVAVMNEQGAQYFDRYEDADGTVLQGRQIGTWDPVSADWGSFISASQRIAFTVRQAPGARLHRGRELLGSRVAWSGFGYTFPPAPERFAYEVDIARTT
jgi:hypothetical protein